MAALLDGLAAPEGRTIAYREEVHHPALLIPEETREEMLPALAAAIEHLPADRPLPPAACRL